MTQLRDVKRQSPRVMCEMTAMNNNTNLMLNREAPPFDNPDIRRALVLAHRPPGPSWRPLEGSGMVGGHLQPVARRPMGHVGRGTGWHAGLRCQRREEPRGGARADAQGGLRPGKPLPLKIFTRAVSLYRSPAAVLACQLQEIHIEPTLDVVETVALVHARCAATLRWPSRPPAMPSTIPTRSSTRPSPAGRSATTATTAIAEIERLFEAQSSELDVEKRRRLVWDIDAKLLADSARPPLIGTAPRPAGSPTCRATCADQQLLQRLPLRGRLARPALSGRHIFSSPFKWGGVSVLR